MKRFPKSMFAVAMGAVTVLFSLSSAPGPAGPGQDAVVKILPTDSDQTLLEKAARVVPSERQLAWQELEFQAFVHFGMNTFTDREWGEGAEDPKLFNPTDLDADQWAEAFKSAGMKGVVLTAKHHDGFCLWPSRYTEHSVAASPWKEGRGDVVREVAEACRRAGLKFGVYVSPWDRHEPGYGDSPRYNAHFKNQLRELLTGYGEISEVWFDGACGEGPNGKRQVYDWEGYWGVIRELQPKAVISIMGPDVRWCGNEAGRTRESEWSVIPLARFEDSPDDKTPGGVAGLEAGAPDLGSLERIREFSRRGGRLVWYPAQVNTSIRPGWFYHRAEDMKVKTLDHLLEVYFGSVGGNAQFLLNVPPDKRGRIPENDVLRLKEIGDALRTTFSRNLAEGARLEAAPKTGGPDSGPEKTIDGDPRTHWMPGASVAEPAVIYDLGVTKTFNVAMLRENIRTGQRIAAFALEAWDGAGWKEIFRGTTVGYKKLVRFPSVQASRVRLRIVESRLAPAVAEFGLFLDPVPSGDVGSFRRRNF
jgi:alpha-L-fucosidase